MRFQKCFLHLSFAPFARPTVIYLSEFRRITDSVERCNLVRVLIGLFRNAEGAHKLYIMPAYRRLVCVRIEANSTGLMCPTREVWVEHAALYNHYLFFLTETGGKF